MFVRTTVVAVASAWVAAAQTSSDSVTHHTHAAFAFVRTGERTPFLANASQTLTALGAKQMYELGQNFRTRYIAGDQPQKLGVQRIAGMSVDTLNNDQIWVQTLDRPYLISSAQAFMQGLYPPSNSSSATSQLTDGTSVEYPFSGYQYANIRTASQTDPDSRYLAGLQNCPAGQTSAMNYFSTEAFKETESASEDLFNKLDPDWLDGALPEAYFDIRSVLEISDYISYQYVHNSTMHDILSANNSNYTGVYDRLNYLADQVAWGLYGNTSESSRVSNNQAIGGKSLASSILNTFRMRIAQQRGMSDDSAMAVSLPPLTLYFGDQDPMISLASLLRLDTKSPYFQSIPPYGSAMIFELFSVSNSSSSVEMPTNPDDLWVRFSFHNATATGNSSNNDQLTAYPMFNNGPSNTDVQWIDFEPLFGDIALGGIARWCDECNSGSIFCSGADGSPYFRDGDRGGRGRKPKKGGDDDDDDDDGMSPAVAGVIGAVVTLIVATLLFALFMFLAGLRFRRVQKPNLFKKAKSGLGGFKGSSKMASDPDLALARNGAAMPVAPPPAAVDVAAGAAGATGDHKYAYHERSGSWELRQKEFGKDVKLVERESLDEGGAKVVQPRNGV